MIFGKLIVYYHHYNLGLGHFHHPEKFPQDCARLQAPRDLLSVSVDLPFLDISHKWNHNM